MSPTNPLDNLSRPGGSLKPEPPDAAETAGLLRTGRARLADASNTTLALESRFDLAYNAAHALCLAALRAKGYRGSNRYIVFQIIGVRFQFSPQRRGVGRRHSQPTPGDRRASPGTEGGAQSLHSASCAHHKPSIFIARRSERLPCATAWLV